MCRNVRIPNRISSAGVGEGQQTGIVIRCCALLALVLMMLVWPPGTEAAEPYPDPASEMWLEVRQSTDPKLLESFIEAFPDSPYAHAARARLGRLKAAPAGTDEDSESVIITYPAPGTAPQTAPPGPSGTAAPAPGAVQQTAPAAPAAPAPAARAPGSSFRDRLQSGGEGPEMVVIPAGRFRMGCVSGRDCDDDENPVHEVAIARPFALSKYEVTFEDYDRFTHPNKVDDAGWGRGRRPVMTVSWDDAREYAAWLSAQTGKNYRLPTEAEWEYAARAGSITAYSWGNDIGQNRANCYADYCGDRWEYTAPVGSFAPNAWGLHDMHGNVFEWVEDCWNESYAGAPSDGSAWGRGNCNQRVVRGGSWYFRPAGLRSADRFRDTRSDRVSVLGFRLAQDL